MGTKSVAKDKNKIEGTLFTPRWIYSTLCPAPLLLARTLPQSFSHALITPHFPS